MSFPVMIIIAVIIGSLTGALVYFITNRQSAKKLPRINFNEAQEKAVQGLQKKKDAYEKEMTQEARQEVADFLNKLNAEKCKLSDELTESICDLEEKKHQNEMALKQAEHDYQENVKAMQKIWQEQESAAYERRRADNEKVIEQFEAEKNAELEKLKVSYGHKEKGLTEDFLAYSAEVSMKREALTKEIEAYEAQQRAIIERFKKDEEIRQQVDFYRMILSENEIFDIKKIRSIAEDLHNPIILYKLIWENFYKNKFSELVGRVAGDKKCGIYKITNLKNQKSYIGQTRQSFKERWRTHVKRGLRAEPTTNNKLYSSMWEDGVENFTFEIICQCSPEELNEQEKRYIAFYNALEWGYNSTGGNTK